METLQALALEYGQTALGYLRQPAILFQLGLIVFLFLTAKLLKRRLHAQLEGRFSAVKDLPGPRLLAAFLRRLEWLFFAAFLGLAYVVTSATRWPDTRYLIYSGMMLAGAWLLISVVSHAIRNRLVGQAFTVIVWALVAASILGITDDIATVLDGIGFEVASGGRRLSVLWLLQSSLLLGLILWLSFALGNFFDKRIQRAEELTPSLRVLIGKAVRISLMVLGVLIAMSSLDIDLTALTVLSGAIGVGIGFGLQKVVSNFISGIIILMDQSIKPGDTISLGETFGWIRELRARFVSVVTRDGREYLIPNEDFITREVINWSFSDQFVRLDVPFGVAYDSDPHEVTRLAIAAATAVGRVDSSRNKPVCWMTEFGDSSLNFLLRFWISDPQQGLTNIRGTVLLALWDTFKEHGINIPFPHREVIFKTPIEVVRPPPSGATPQPEPLPPEQPGVARR